MTAMQYREDIKLEQRKVQFDWSHMDSHIIPGDPVTSHCINVLHLMFPAGENWFCKVFAEALPYLEDNPKLKADAIGFMRQEAMHSRSHQAVVDHYQSLGIDAQAASKKFEQLIMTGGGPDKIFGLIKPWNDKARHWWLCRRLAAIACVEHFTCIMGVWALEQKTLDAVADPVMMDLLKWHCAEEVEHRNVAFDIFMHVSGNNHRMRYMTMPLAMFALYRMMKEGAMFLMKQDPVIVGKVNFYRAWEDGAERGLVPSMKMLMKSTKRWFSKKYDPQTEAETKLALDYFAISPAAQAAAAR